MRFWIVVGVWLLVSCNEIRECSLSTNREGAVIAFYEADSLDKYRKSTFYLVNGAGSLDTIRASANLTAVLAEFDPGENSLNYSFRVLDSLAPNNYREYNLWVGYRKQIEIFSEECEPLVNYQLDSIYSPDFDSVALIAGPLDKQVDVNVEVYF